MWTSGQFAKHLARERGSAALWKQRIQPQMRAAVRHSLAAAAVRALSAANPKYGPLSLTLAPIIKSCATRHKQSDTIGSMPSSPTIQPATGCDKRTLIASSLQILATQPD